MINSIIKNILFLLTLNILISSTGYIRVTEVSFCMDECSMYYLESEFGEYISNISFGEIDPNLYINRYVTVDGMEISCVECTTLQIEQINLSGDCENPLPCFVNPCEVAEECQLNTPVECVPNYCGGCYADFYDSDDVLVDCYNSQDLNECFDFSEIDFGLCDMLLGVAIVDGVCNYVSGCGWTSGGIDYSDLFFDSIMECEENCYNDVSCESIESDYESLLTDEYSQCEYNIDCVSIWGDCGVGLGGCHYSINPELYGNSSVDALVELWMLNDCMDSVCDCMSLPNSICNNGNCELAYCYGENPTGCNIAGCSDGYQCIDVPNTCVPSQCFCDDFYGEWYCTEDCGGGTCVPILPGDVNYDNDLNVVDVIMIVNMILGLSEDNFIADMNNDNFIDIIDIVTIVSIILNN